MRMMPYLMECATSGRPPGEGVGLGVLHRSGQFSVHLRYTHLGGGYTEGIRGGGTDDELSFGKQIFGGVCGAKVGGAGELGVELIELNHWIMRFG